MFQFSTTVLFESTDNDMCGRLVRKINDSKLLLWKICHKKNCNRLAVLIADGKKVFSKENKENNELIEIINTVQVRSLKLLGEPTRKPGAVSMC